MSGVNKVIIVGHLGSDPELKHVGNGTAVTNFSVATNERWKDAGGEMQERTEWHRIVAWKKTAELCVEYLRKGRQVYIDGKLQTREWEDSSGTKRYTTEIVALNVVFLGGKSDSNQPQRQQQQQGLYEQDLPVPSDDVPF